MSSLSHAVLVANGPLAPEAAGRLHSAVSGALIVGIDGGAHHLLALGIVPNIVTGDFDSLSDVTLGELAIQGVEIVPTPDQNFTDLDKALAYVLHDRGCVSARIFAATEGRIDHIYSALSALLKYRNSDVRLVDAFGETFCMNESMTLQGDDLPNRVLSLLAMGLVNGVTTTGVRWPLTNETLGPGVRDGTLNVVTETTVTIAGTGDLLVSLQHAPEAAP